MRAFVVTVILTLIGPIWAGSICGTELGMKIKHVVQDGLGVKEIQDMYDRDATFNLKVPNGHERVNKIAVDLGLYIGELYGVVQRNHDAILMYIAASRMYIDISSFVEVEEVQRCCDLNPSSLNYVPHLGVIVQPRTMCVTESSIRSNTTYLMSKELLRTMEENPERVNNLGYQYYSTEDGLQFGYTAKYEMACDTCCYDFDPRKSIPYNEATSPRPKDIVIAIDVSDQGNLDLKMEAAATLLTTMSPRNRIAVVVFCHNVEVHLGTNKGDACYSSRLALATSRNVKSFLDFLSEVLVDESMCSTKVRYIPAIEKSFEYFRTTPSGSQKRRKMFVLLTDSDPNDAGSDDRIVVTMAKEKGKVGNEVQVLTFSFGSNFNSSTEMLLRQLADTKYNASDGKEMRGSYANIRSSGNLRSQLGSFYDSLADAHTKIRPVITAPYMDLSGIGLIVSICKPVVYGASLGGVTCVDVKAEDLFLNVTYYEQGVRAYAFLMNSEGRAIVHPLLPKPSALHDDPFFVDISSLEPEDEAQEVIESMKGGGTGYKTFYTNRQYDERSSIYRKIASHYYWTTVNNTDFAICLVFTDDDGEISLDIKYRGEVNFHDASELSSEQTLYTYQDTFVYKGASTVAFNGSAYKYIDFGSSTSRGNPLVNYFTGDAEDQGRQFKNHIKAEVEFTGRADWVWTKPSSSKYDNWIVWRILVTKSVLRIYPGTTFRTFNPNLQEWYQNAITNSGQMAFTRIRKEKERAIMVSSAIFAGSPDGRHSSLDPTIAVVAGEFSCNRFYMMMLSTFDACKEKNAICFLVDDKGFVIVHTLYIASWRSASHLITMEPAIAEYLQRTGDLSKTTCLDLGNYRIIHGWNLAPNDWIVEGDSPRFELHRLAGTNIMAGITWRDFDGKDTVCDCTNVTKCIESCDCPCYETLSFDYCENRFSNLSGRASDGSRPCPVLEDIFDPIFTTDLDANIPTFPYFTTPVPCVAIQSLDDCLQKTTCEWCIGDEGEKCTSSGSCTQHVTLPPPAGSILDKKEFAIGLPVAVCIAFALILFCIVTLYMRNKQRRKLHVKVANGATVSKDSYQTKAERIKNGSTAVELPTLDTNSNLHTDSSTPKNDPNTDSLKNDSALAETTTTESNSGIKTNSVPPKYQQPNADTLKNGNIPIKSTTTENHPKVATSSAPPRYQKLPVAKPSTKTPPEPPPRYRNLKSVDDEAPYGNHIAIAMWHNFDCASSLDLSYPNSEAGGGGGENSQTEVKKPVEHEISTFNNSNTYENSPARPVENADVPEEGARQISSDSGFPSGNVGSTSSTTYPKFYA